MARNSSSQASGREPAAVSPFDGREERLSKWLVCSTFLHAAFIASLFVVPYLPLRSAPSYPVYTVDLVGGEKVGGATLGTELAPAPPKEKPKKTEAEPPPPTVETKREKKEEVKKEKKKPIEAGPPPQEIVALKKPEKKEPAKEEPPKKEPVKAEPVAPKIKTKPDEPAETKTAEEGLPDRVREKLIQAALERVRKRAETAQQKEKTEAIQSGPADGEGSAALGPGGRGGGIVKGIEFIVYRNRMLHLIRERWAWVGKRNDLEVTVHFGVQESGEIAGLRILRASGDPSYDDSVIRAVRKSSPLPPPPESYRRDFLDVELTFRPKDLGG